MANPIIWARPSVALHFCAVADRDASVITHCRGRWEPSEHDEIRWSVPARERCGGCVRELEAATQPTRYGADGLRDPANPCIYFTRGVPAGTCAGDGHRLCGGCVQREAVDVKSVDVEALAAEGRALLSGARIIKLARKHNLITADELPTVLTAIDEARNGPAEFLPHPLDGEVPFAPGHRLVHPLPEEIVEMEAEEPAAPGDEFEGAFADLFEVGP